LTSLENKVLDFISNFLGFNKDQLDLDSGLSNPSEWDSMKHTMLIIELENFFEISFDFEELDKIVTVREIIKSLKKKGIK